MAVVEPEARGSYEDGPVGGVFCEGGGEEGEGDGEEEGERGELHSQELRVEEESRWFVGGET